MSFPPGTEMFQFPGFASTHYVFMCRSPSREGLPHSDIHGSKPARGSPWLFAACHVLHRLLMPRHPPNALIALKDVENQSFQHHAQKQNTQRRYLQARDPQNPLCSSTMLSKITEFPLSFTFASLTVCCDLGVLCSRIETSRSD
jgi:hypothetical protein